MPEQFYDSYANEQALQDQTKRILKMFDRVEAGVVRLKNLGIDINASKSVKGVNELTVAFKEQNETIKQQQKELNDLAAKLSKYTAEGSKQAEEIRQVTKLQKGLTAEEAKQTLLRQGASESLIKMKTANAELAKSLKLRLAISQAAEGSEQKLTLQYQKATLILGKLSKAQRESDRGKALSQFAASLKKELDSIQQKVGNFKGNVGNYANSLSSLFSKVADEIKRLKAEQDKITQRTIVQGFVTAEDQAALDKATNAISELGTVMASAEKPGQSLQKTVRQIGFAVGNLASAGNQTEEFLNTFKVEAAKAKDAARDIREEIEALSSDTRKLDLAAGAVTTLADGFQAAYSASALFGGENEEQQKILTKLVAVQGVANSIRSIGNEITRRGTAANKAYNFVIKQGEILFGKGSTAAQRFGVALKAIAVVAVITFLIKIVESMNLFADAQEEAIDRTKRLNEAMTDLNDVYSKQTEIIGQAANDNLRLLRAELSSAEARGASAIELFNLKKKIADEEADIIDKQIDDVIRRAEAEEFNYTAGQEGIKGEDALVNAYIHFNEKYAETLKQLEVLQKKRVNILNLGGAASDTEDIEKEIEAENTKLQFYKSKVDDYANISQKQLDAVTAQDNLRLAEAKRIADAEKKASLDLFLYKQDLIKQQAELDSSTDSPYSVKTKLEAAKKIADAEIKSINKQRTYDLSQQDLAASQRVLIDLKANDEIAKARNDLSIRLIQIQVDENNKRKAYAEQGVTDFETDMADRAQREQDALQTAFEKEQDLLKIQYSQSEQLAAKNFKDGLTTKEGYDEAKLKNEKEYQRLVLESQIRFYETQIALLKAAGKDTTAMQAALEEARAAIATGEVEVATASADQLKSILEQTKQNYIDTYKQIAEIFSNVIGGLAEKEKQRINDQIELIDKKKAREIEAANASTDSEEKKAARITIIEARAQIAKEALARRQRQIDRQTAIADKAFKVLQITTDTIQAVAKIKAALSIAIGTSLTNPLAAASVPLLSSQLALTIAGGIAAVTSVLAQPLPKFASGTESSPAGKALVGEEGAELGVDRSGKLHYWNKPTIADLKEGTKIFPADVTRDLVSSSKVVIRESRTVDRTQQVDRTQEEMLWELKQIRKKQANINIFNDRNIETTVYYQQHLKN